jgi:hypothetical protein
VFGAVGELVLVQVVLSQSINDALVKALAVKNPFWNRHHCKRMRAVA